MNGIRIVLFLLLVSLAACACTRSNQIEPVAVPVAVVDNGIMMANGDRTAGGQWIEDKDQLTALIDRFLTKTTIPGKTLSTIDKVDFSKQSILVIWMGEKPTGGFALGLTAAEARIVDGIAQVRVKWVEPGKNVITAQVVTNPYLMLVLDKGPYDTVSVIDQDKGERVRVALTE